MSVFAAAREYEKLLNTEYVLTVRKNRNSNPQVIRLRFDKSDFHHICGLHKLATAPQLKTEASQTVFEKIISRVYEDQMFEKDPDYSKIEERIALITDLVSFLESDNTVLKINRNSPVRFSKIDADFVVSQRDLHHSLLFVKSFDGSDIYHPCSCFKRSLKDRDITQGDIKLHIIKKERVNLDTNERVILSQMVTKTLAQPVHESYTPTIAQSSAQSSAPSKDGAPPPAVPEQPKYLSRAKRKELKRNAQQATKQPQTSTPGKKHEIGGDELE